MGGFSLLIGRARAFGRDRNGNFAVVTGVMCLALVMAGGFALNIAQIVMTRANLLNALDSGVTSTARDLTTGKISPQDARPTVLAFLQANGGTGFASADRINLDSLVVDQTAKTVSAQASVDINLVFPVFRGSSVEHVEVNSAALYSDKKIEVAMMLDTTGSMAGQKIKDLRTAASNAVRTFLDGQDAASPRVRVAIVPYADSVNTGILSNTVYDETKGGTVVPPALDAPRNVSSYHPDDCATERKGADGNMDFSDAGPYTSMVNRDYRLTFCPGEPLHPLTGDETALLDTIGTFAANGSTAGHIGIQWTRYMLSPNWASVLPAESAPSDYNAEGTAKYAILMTDGEFNTAFAGVGKNGDVHNQAALSSSNAETLCTEMKKDGIQIFTIGFMLDEPGARATLQNCASTDSSSIPHFYAVADGASLNSAFQEIAGNIERLALTK